MRIRLFTTEICEFGYEGKIGEVGLGTEYDIDQYYNILDIDFAITI